MRSLMEKTLNFDYVKWSTKWWKNSLNDCWSKFLWHMFYNFLSYGFCYGQRWKLRLWSNTGFGPSALDKLCQYSSFDIFGLWIWTNYSTFGFGQIFSLWLQPNYSTFCHSLFSKLFHCNLPLALPPSMMVHHSDYNSLSLDKIEHFRILAKLFGPIIEPLVSLWVQTCFTACQPLALAPSFWWSFPQCLRDRIHFLTPFLIGFSADV